MLQIARICLFGVFTIRFFVKNRELWPDKNKFTFALGKLTTELAEIRLKHKQINPDSDCFNKFSI